MPAGDLIIQRLDEATDGEMRAMSIALREKQKFHKLKTRPERIDFLSRYLRSDAGSFLGNLLRHDHELTYFEILKDIVNRAASIASWPPPPIEDDIPLERLEDYVVRALAFTATKPKSPIEATKSRRDAEKALLGEIVDPPPASRRDLLSASALGAAKPLGFALAAAIGGPALRRTLPAVLVLVHIRHRLRIEKTLRGAS